MGDFLVNFAIVGTQKGGTTALAKFLAQHPEVCFAPGKEVHFFDAPDYCESRSWAQLNQEYQQAFSNFRGQKLVGEATPAYMYLPWVAQRIYNYNPEMKLIFLLREPVERAVSHYQMELERQAEWLPLRWALAVEPVRLWRDRHNYQFNSSLRCHSYLDRGCYARQILQMMRYFPREQMLFLKTSELWHQHRATLQRVYNFLGLTAGHWPAQELVFSGGGAIVVSQRLRDRLTAHFQQANQLLQAILNWSEGF